MINQKKHNQLNKNIKTTQANLTSLNLSPISLSELEKVSAGMHNGDPYCIKIPDNPYIKK
ncbi:MAG: hypothetical protein QNJ53_25505 [Pleurocapsa sp. MO_192.B19]|nr:hypothetical protein [Pleurocapsa sp. MO_192.B19]